MKAVANYNITIDGVIYKKGEQYDIDPKINQSNPFGGDYFTEVEPKEETKKAKSDTKKEETKKN